MSIKISVIVPVYNVAPYLKNCVASITNQSYANIEIILVNDGSTDESGKICDQLEKSDKRILVIHKQNGGLSDARNAGISHAAGDYIVFIDSDDYWDDPDALKNMAKQIVVSKSDVMIFGYKKGFEQNTHMIPISPIAERLRIIGVNKTDAFTYMLTRNIFISSAWSKLIKRSLFENNDLLFKKGITSEDIDWSARLAIAAERFDYYPNNFYVYLQRAGSITKTMTIRNIQTLTDNIKTCIAYGEPIKENDFYPAYLGYVAYQYITLLANSIKLSRQDRQETKTWLKQNTWLLKYGKSRKGRLIYYAFRLFGFNVMYTLLTRFLKSKQRAIV